MSRELRYRVVDVFTEVPLEGNPLAVFYEGRGLDDVTMQRIARELNLSETAFLLRTTHPKCVARLRIFTPAREMRFAGHPTIGAAFVARERGIAARDLPAFALEEGIGPVAVRIEDARLWLSTPPIERVGECDRTACARALDLREWDLLPNVPPQVYSAGNPMLFIPVTDRESVDRASVDGTAFRALEEAIGESIGLFVFTPTPAGAYSRMFAPELGIVEDPATGSATGPLAAYMMEHDLCATRDGTSFVSEQGTKMGRRSFLHVYVRGERGRDGIDVGGHVTPLAEAVMTLP
ncbi:MAG TPA: PhzF family phenazine biosynthesis protein [Candidatus Tyrphobacter sp.]